MDDQDHYAFLGVPRSASLAELTRAVEELSRRARALAGTVPAQSHRLRDRLRQIREDLLTSPARRAAYDAQLDRATSWEAPRDIPLTARYEADRAEEYAARPPPAAETTRILPAVGTPPAARRRAVIAGVPLWALAVFLVAALLVGGAAGLAAVYLSGGGHSAAHSPPAAAPTTPPRATPTSSPVPTNTPNPTSEPSVTPLPADTATPSPADTATPVPTPLPTVDPVAHDLDVMTAKGYTADLSQHAATPDRFGDTLHAWLATRNACAVTACQRVFFFIGTRYLGTDMLYPSRRITAVAAGGPQDVDVTYANYQPDDPECCPSGDPVTITFHWTGSRLIPSGIPPGH